MRSKFAGLMTRRRTLEAVTLLTASAAVSALAGRANAASAAEPIRIGSINDVTGFAAAYGVPERDGQRLAVRMINEKGGINGRPLELVERDTQGDTNRTVLYF